MNQLIIVENGIVKYNRSAIMKQGWAFKKEDGISNGISVAWAIARQQRAEAEAQIEAEIEEALRIEEAELMAEYEAEMESETAIMEAEEEEIRNIQEEQNKVIQLTEWLKNEYKTRDNLFKLAKDVRGKNSRLDRCITTALIELKEVA